MTQKADMNAVTMLKRLPDLRLAVAVGVAEQPKIGNAGEPNVAVSRHDPRADAGGRIVETVGEHDGVIGLAVAVAILDQTNAVVLGLEGREIFAQVFVIHFHAIGDGPTGKVVVEPVHMAPDIGHTGMMTECFGEVESILPIDAESHRVRQHRLACEQLDGQARRDSELFDGELAFVGRPFHLGRVGFILFRRDAETREAEGKERGDREARNKRAKVGDFIGAEAPCSGGILDRGTWRDCFTLINPTLLPQRPRLRHLHEDLSRNGETPLTAAIRITQRRWKIYNNPSPTGRWCPKGG